MAKIKFTKGELKKQRDSLKQFERYLPTLLLKKQQLQMKILEVRRQMSLLQGVLTRMESAFARWIGLLADPYLPASADFSSWVVPASVEMQTINIAGANLPVFKEVKFSQARYDLRTMPFWVDLAVVDLRKYFQVVAEIYVLKCQMECLDKELRITTQRVNLFEKIKIPESLDNIRRIRIYLGDQMTSAVGICKVAKAKILQMA